MSGRKAVQGETITITLNGRSLEAKAGQTILDIAKQSNVDIPTLCFHPAMEAYGGCRLCMVEIGGKRKKLVTSCNYEIWDSLEIETDSERVHKSRKMTVELFLSRCPEVKVLQALAVKYGIETPRFPLENDDCILCGLCVRVCRERMGVGVADFVGRGAEIKVDTPYHRGSEVCLTCGACESVCPTQSIRLKTVYEKPPAILLSEFEMGLKKRPTIYIPFPQALPNVPVIDRKNCIRFQLGACGICGEACPAGAIDYSQEDEVVDIKAGAVILSPGFCLYDASLKPEYGYSSFTNVVTSLQFERILSASGPYMGKVLRPSDLLKPARIAFIQCVGSRDSGNNFCSSVCCMYAVKEAIIAREHEEDIVCDIFYMDLRAHGKGFDAYYERAKDLGIDFTRCRPSKVEELPGGDLRIGYVDDNGGYKTKEFDMVVLSAGLKPPVDALKLAEKFGIELNGDGFAVKKPFDPVSSVKDGIYVCGPFSEPKDIPETVMEASSASSRAMVQLSDVRGTQVEQYELPPERDITGEPPRIGVFVCHCGKNIGGIVNVPSVAEYAAMLPNVVYATDNLYTCSSDTQTVIKERIKEYGLNRVIVASCSPRTHEPLFQQTIREAGLNPHLFEMANIRDQCSWVHMHEKAAATVKAKDLVRMAVAKARKIEPLKSIPLKVTRKALVVGGGLAGMTSALSIADQGFEVFLVEKSACLGGNALKIDKTIDGYDVGEYIQSLVERVTCHSNISLFTGTEVIKVDGFVGNFVTTLRTRSNGGIPEETQIEHGVAVIATGGSEAKPKEYLYGESGRVKTLLELNERIAQPDFTVPDNVVFIQCVGSRESGHMYCSRVCCTAAIKNAIRMKELRPDANVFILYRDIRTYGFREKQYSRAREMGITFVRYELNRKPVVKADGDEVSVEVYDHILGVELEIPAGLLVLSSRINPNPDNEQLSRFFKVPLNSEKFFLEAHVKLRPVEFATDGVYVCGLAHYPKDMIEAVSQAMAAAGRALPILSKDFIEGEGKICYVNEARCAGCGACVTVCAYNAVTLDETRGVASINEAVCKGCGACAATCRGSAINLRGFKDEQILNILKVL
ncbi:MAG: 2Fe-2S iron-sulfur cluster-binding protein [Spirochaetota bacterium]